MRFQESYMKLTRLHATSSWFKANNPTIVRLHHLRMWKLSIIGAILPPPSRHAHDKARSWWREREEKKLKLRLCYSVTFCHQHQFSSFPSSLSLALLNLQDLTSESARGRGDVENEFNSNDMKSMKSFKRLLIKKFIRYTREVLEERGSDFSPFFHFIQFNSWQRGKKREFFSGRGETSRFLIRFLPFGGSRAFNSSRCV